MGTKLDAKREIAALNAEAAILQQDLESFLEVLRAGPPSLTEHLINLMSRFGEDGSWETTMISKIFYGDTEAFDTYDAEVAPHFSDPVNAIYEYGLMRCFHPNLEFPKDEEEEAWFYLDRWQRVTRNLMQLDIHAPDDSPWLYGWACFGVFLYALLQRPRNYLWYIPCPAAIHKIAQNGTGCEFMEDLPPSAELMLGIRGMGRKRLRELTLGMIVMILKYKVHCHPTMEEMQSM